MTEFCSADLSEGVAGWTWLIANVTSSEGINLSLSIASGLNGLILDLQKREMIVFMDNVFSNISLNRMGKFVLLTVTLVAPCVTLANVIKSGLKLKWFFSGLHICRKVEEGVLCGVVNSTV